MWRPLPPIDEFTGAGCYSLVGSQGISSIDIPDEDGDPVTLRPSLQSNIPFQPGDVLGFYIDIPDSDEIEYDIEIQSAPGNNHTVWYADDQNLITSTAPTYYFIGSSPPGTLATLRYEAPAISITIRKCLYIMILA